MDRWHEAFGVQVCRLLDRDVEFGLASDDAVAVIESAVLLQLAVDAHARTWHRLQRPTLCGANDREMMFGQLKVTWYAYVSATRTAHAQHFAQVHPESLLRSIQFVNV